MSIPARGVKNVRTLSGRVDQLALPYRSYMQVTCLEMEKARRNAERRSASRHMAEIDARLEEIEKEKSALLTGIGRAPKQPAGKEGRPGPPRGAGGFRIRY